MIAYKLFCVNGKDFESGTMSGSLYPYSKDYIWQRPDGWGPFACFADTRHAAGFKSLYGWTHTALYKVRIKLSKETSLWYVDKRGILSRHENLPMNTILVDEFEILERVK